MQEKISIIMPVKNATPFLKECLSSILNQSHKNWELWAVDDHSMDSSNRILEEYAKSDDRINVLKNEGNGIVSALRTAYKNVTGSFIHRMDADDIMPESKLELMHSHWKPKSVVTGKVHYFSDEWEVGEGFINYQNWINGLMESNNFWKDIYMECPIPSPGWLIHVKDFENIGGFKSDGMPEDYDLCFRIYQHKLNVVCVQKIIHHWRDSSQRVSRNSEVYYPMSYYPLKVSYFLKLDRDSKLPLLLAGAGKKGKRIAQLLKQHNQEFIWMTNNLKKVGQDIYGKVIRDWREVAFENYQVMFAVSSPESKLEIREELSRRGILKSLNYFWFC